MDAVLIKLGKLRVSAIPVVSRKDLRKLLGVISKGDVAVALARAADGAAADGGDS